MDFNILWIIPIVFIAVGKMLFYAAVIFGIWKILALSRETKELKNLLTNIKTSIDQLNR